MRIDIPEGLLFQLMFYPFIGLLGLILIIPDDYVIPIAILMPILFLNTFILIKLSPRSKWRCKITQEEAVTISPSFYCRTHHEQSEDHFNRFKVWDDNKNDEVLAK